MLEKYSAETVQIYFPGSLELQEELTNHGFGIPRPTPIPIIYVNFGGWINPTYQQPITIERLIEPTKYGVSFEEMGYKRTLVKGKEAYEITPEEGYVKFELIEKDRLMIRLSPIKYHLERISIRGINPDKWSNWAMIYISLTDANALKRKMSEEGFKSLPERRPKKEIQQGGKEVTFKLPVTVYDFKLCLGCFDYALEYLRLEAAKQNIKFNPAQLKLSLRKGEEDSFLKVGKAQMEGKHPQLMMKLASSDKKTITGILKPTLEGKPRGTLQLCDHTQKEQFFIVSANEFFEALYSAI